LEALRLPPESRIAALVKQGVPGYRRLREIAFESEESLSIRWRALMSMALIGRELSLPEIEKGLQHKEWFLRSGSLKAMSRLNSEKSVSWARRLLDDKALVVRSTAVSVLKEQRDLKSGDLLWKKLNSKENYRGNVGLWIRQNIVSTLADFARREDVPKFMALLDGDDVSLHGSAILGLERITQQRLGQPIEPIAYKRTYWRTWWAENHGQNQIF
jgi:HEAT repeat protein